jgi:hypothetical protein
VAPAPELDVSNRCLTADRVGPEVVELDERPFPAPTTFRTHERASPTIPDPDGSPDLGGDVAQSRRLATRGAGLVGCSELLSCELIEQDRERSVENGRVVARGDGVA